MGNIIELAKEMADIKIKQDAFKNGAPLPLVARKFIELAAKKGIELQVSYGIQHNGDAIHVGYWIHSADKEKAIFQIEKYMENESDENVSAAMAFFESALEEFHKS